MWKSVLSVATGDAAPAPLTSPALMSDATMPGRSPRLRPPALAGFAAAAVASGCFLLAGCSQAGADDADEDQQTTAVAASEQTAADSEDKSAEDKAAADRAEALRKAAVERNAGLPVRVEPVVASFGELQSNTTGTMEVKIHNTGDEPLTFARVTTSCSCTQGSIEHREIVPGDAAILTIRYDAGNINGYEMKRHFAWIEGGRRPVEIPVTVNITGGMERGATTAEPPGGPEVNATPRPARPSVRIEPPVVDAGFLRPEGTTQRTVKIHNTGEHPLRFTRVATDCSCAVGSVEDKEVAPGEHAEMIVTFTARPTVGPLKQTLRVFAAGSRVPVDVEVKAMVTNVINADPFYLNLLAGRTGSLELVATDDTPFRILSMDGEKPSSRAVESADRSATKHIVNWDLTDVADADLRQWFVVETDHPEMPVVDFRVIHPVVLGLGQVEHWTLSHDRLSLGWLNYGETIEREITLVNLRSDSLKDVVSRDGHFDIEIADRTMTPRGLRFTLRATVTAEPGTMIASPIVVRSDDPSYSSRIFIFGKVRDE